MTREPTLSLDELGKLVEDVARERRVDARVVGVTPTGGDGTYAEVLIARGDDLSPLSIGVRRDDAVSDLRREIAARLSDG